MRAATRSLGDLCGLGSVHMSMALLGHQAKSATAFASGADRILRAVRAAVSAAIASIMKPYAFANRPNDLAFRLATGIVNLPPRRNHSVIASSVTRAISLLAS
jgi:hypothetical protein